MSPFAERTATLSRSARSLVLAGVLGVAAVAPALAQERAQGQPVADLTTRYRFIEQYATAADPAHPEALVQTRVAMRETITTETETRRGAPQRRQIVAQTIYTERTAAFAPDGAVKATIRRYDAFRLNPDPGVKTTEPRPLEGLTAWIEQAGAEGLKVLCLSENRRIRTGEFDIIRRETSLPLLSAILPTQPIRLGDRWIVPSRVGWGLVGEALLPKEGLTATLKDIRTEAKGPNHVAIIGVTSGTLPFNAEVQFTFTPPAPAPASAPAAAGSDAAKNTAEVEIRGAITELRLAQVSNIPLPESNGRLHQVQTRELILARQRDQAALLTIPIPEPIPTEANSWLAYVDSQRRFHFLYPQSYQSDTPAGPETIELIRPRSQDPDVIEIKLLLKTGDPAADRRNVDPEFHRRNIEEEWRQSQWDVLRGARGWLPEADWKPLGLKVYRIEAAARGIAGRNAPLPHRIHADYYLVLTGRTDNLLVTAMTVQDPPAEFRKETEALLKTFRFGPPEK
jgi:hypothetical protein